MRRRRDPRITDGRAARAGRPRESAGGEREPGHPHQGGIPQFPGRGQWKPQVIHTEEIPQIVRVRIPPPKAARRGVYGHVVTIHWHYEPANESGMPTDEVGLEMDRFERAFQAILEPRREGFLMSALLGKGLRVWAIYCRNPAETEALIQEVVTGHGPFPIQLTVRPDPNWAIYDLLRGRPIASSPGGGAGPGIAERGGQVKRPAASRTRACPVGSKAQASEQRGAKGTRAGRGPHRG